MSVKIRTAGFLKEQIPQDTTIDDVSTVGEAIDQLDLLDMSEFVILLVNGKSAYWETELHDGDVLSILPGLSGGSVGT